MARKLAAARGHRARQAAAQRRKAQAHRAGTRFFAGFISPGDLVFDIGANVGGKSAIFLELGARVVALEPQAECAQRLAARFGDALTIIPQGVASEPGTRTLAVSNANTVSSMEPEWIEAVTESQRFGSVKWNESVEVEVTTLDELIDRYGCPAFTKIDVEGFELAVLEGLRRPLPALSFEFVAERVDATSACVRRLQSLGPTEFNFSTGESMTIGAPEWMTGDDLLHRLIALDWGDVYARSLPARA